MRTRSYHTVRTGIQAVTAWGWVWLAAALVVNLTGCAGKTPAPDTGAYIADLQLPAPELESERRYLGLGNGSAFRLSEIEAEVLIIEAFSLYCPYCQREAPVVDALFRRIQRQPELRRKVKLIGIGRGNSPYEVAFFRKKYSVPFPLFADLKKELAERLEIRSTPTFIVVRKTAPGRPEVRLHHAGPLGPVGPFLDRVRAATGL